MRFFAFMTSLAASASMVSAAEHVVKLGVQDGASVRFVFTPDNVRAAAGDTVRFQWQAGRHGVVSSAFSRKYQVMFLVKCRLMLALQLPANRMAPSRRLSSKPVLKPETSSFQSMTPSLSGSTALWPTTACLACQWSSTRAPRQTRPRWTSTVLLLS